MMRNEPRVWSREKSVDPIQGSAVHVLSGSLAMTVKFSKSDADLGWRGAGVSAIHMVFGSLATTVTEEGNISSDASPWTRSAGFGNVLYIEPRDVYLFSLQRRVSVNAGGGLPLVIQ